MPEAVVETPQVPIQQTEEKLMSAAIKKQRVQSLVSTIRGIGFSENDAMRLSVSVVSSMEKESECDVFVRKFRDSEAAAYVGMTAKGGKNKHQHSYAVIMLDGGKSLVGVTTTGNHVHTINLSTDYNIIALEAYTAYADMTPDDDKLEMEDWHHHSFKSNLEKIREEAGTIWPKSGYYFNEEGEMKQGDMNLAETAPATEAMTAYVVPAPEAKDGKGHYLFSNQRQGEVLLNRVAHLSEAPAWFEGGLDDLQSRVFNTVSAEHPNADFSHINIVEEMAISLAAKGKTNPKAKVRNRGTVVFPANSKNVTDKKDHFPINSMAQARNALARVAQYKTKPKWFKGTLASVQSTVRAAVKKKYPSVKVSKLNEYFAIRFKEESDVFFHYLSTGNLETAKHDASVYFNECDKGVRIDVVKFESKVDGESKFTDLGTIALYDRTGKHDCRTSMSSEIKLSASNKDGTIPVEILREGNYLHEEYGDISITSDFLGGLVKNFNSRALARDVSFDMNHKPDLPAAAWVKSLSLSSRSISGNNRRVLNAHVELTPGGRKAVEDKEFRYFSAEYSNNFVDKETGYEYGPTLKGGGFTNRPWIPGMAPVQLSEITDRVGFISKS